VGHRVAGGGCGTTRSQPPAPNPLENQKHAIRRRQSSPRSRTRSLKAAGVMHAAPGAASMPLRPAFGRRWILYPLRRILRPADRRWKDGAAETPAPAASRRRRWSGSRPRSSPESPISRNEHQIGATGRSFTDDAIATAMARSAAGSLMRMPRPH